MSGRKRGDNNTRVQNQDCKNHDGNQIGTTWARRSNESLSPLIFVSLNNGKWMHRNERVGFQQEITQWSIEKGMTNDFGDRDMPITILDSVLYECDGDKRYFHCEGAFVISCRSSSVPPSGCLTKPATGRASRCRDRN